MPTMTRDPTAKKTVRTYRQIEAAFAKLDAQEVKVRAKYEPVKKGEPFKKAFGGQSHRFANVLTWEDDISTIRPKTTQDSLTGERRPATAPTARLKSRALQTAFSAQMLTDEGNQADGGDPTASPTSTNSAGLKKHPSRRHSAAAATRLPASNGSTPRMPSPRKMEQAEGVELDEENSLPVPSSVITSNGIIGRRPPSASIATAKARRILSARHFSPPVTTVGPEELEELKALTRLGSASRPSSASPSRGQSPNRGVSPGRGQSPGRGRSPRRDVAEQRQRPSTARPRSSASMMDPTSQTGSAQAWKARPVSAMPGYRPPTHNANNTVKAATAAGPRGTGLPPSSSSRPLTAGSSSSATLSRTVESGPSHQRPGSATSKWSLPSNQDVAAENFAKRLSRVSEDELTRGVQSMMEAGQSGRHLRAVRAARRDMWDSIASSAGVPVGARHDSGAQRSSDSFVATWPHTLGEENDAVVIHEATEDAREQVVSVAAARRYSDCEDDEQEAASQPRRTSIDAANMGAGAREETREAGAAPLLNTLGGLPLDDVPEAENEGRSSRASSLQSTKLKPADTSVSGHPGRSVAESSHGAQQGRRRGGDTRPNTAPACSRRRRQRPKPQDDKGVEGERSYFWATSRKQHEVRGRARSARAAPRQLSPLRPSSSPPPIRPSSPVGSEPQHNPNRVEALMKLMARGLRASLPTPEEGLHISIEGDSKTILERSNPSEVTRQSDRARSARSLNSDSASSSFWRLDASRPQDGPTQGTQQGAKEHIVVDLTSLITPRAPATDTPVSGSITSPVSSPRQPMQPTKDAHLKPEFYQLQVAVDAGSVGDISSWLFDVTLSEVGGKQRCVTVGRNLHVDKRNTVVFYPDSHRPNPTVLYPPDVLPWLRTPEQLFRKSLRIEVCSSSPQRTKVVDTTVWFGPWDEDGPSYPLGDADSQSEAAGGSRFPVAVSEESSLL